MNGLVADSLLPDLMLELGRKFAERTEGSVAVAVAVADVATVEAANC